LWFSAVLLLSAPLRHSRCERAGPRHNRSRLKFTGVSKATARKRVLGFSQAPFYRRLRLPLPPVAAEDVAAAELQRAEAHRLAVAEPQQAAVVAVVAAAVAAELRAALLQAAVVDAAAAGAHPQRLLRRLSLQSISH
jgi:hypothetical protein